MLEKLKFTTNQVVAIVVIFFICVVIINVFQISVSNFNEAQTQNQNISILEKIS